MSLSGIAVALPGRIFLGRGPGNRRSRWSAGPGGLGASCARKLPAHTVQAGSPSGGPSSLSPHRRVQQQDIIPECRIERRWNGRERHRVRADAGGHRAFRLLDGHDTEQHHRDGCRGRVVTVITQHTRHTQHREGKRSDAEQERYSSGDSGRGSGGPCGRRLEPSAPGAGGGGQRASRRIPGTGRSAPDWSSPSPA